MPFHVGKLTTTVSLVDMAGTLSPDVLDQIVELVVRRMKERARWEALDAAEASVAARMTPED